MPDQMQNNLSPGTTQSPAQITPSAHEKESTTSIGSIWAVGRNYTAHARELKNEIPTEPLIFLKSGGCALTDLKIPLPAFSQELHHELEIAIQFGNLPSANLASAGPAEPLVPTQMRLALDMTARDLQERAKAKSQPWTLAKSFIAGCPLGPEVPFCGFEKFDQLEFEFKVNGETRQIGKTSDMIFKLPELIAYLLARFPVRSGDLLLTGTPSGVAQLVSGNRAEATWSLAGQSVTPPTNWEFV